MWRRATFFIAACWLVLGATAAEPPARQIAGIYSNLTYNSEGGDLLGMELFIHPGTAGAETSYSVYVQIAEGGPPYSVVVPMKVAGDRLEFTLPTSGPYAGEKFVGKVRRNELVVQWRNGAQERLKRGKSYWQ